MLSKYKKNYKKQVMGYLSYLDDFKNLKNLKEEIEFITDPENSFKILIYKGENSDCRGIIGVQEDNEFVVIYYISLDPGFRSLENQIRLVNDLQHMYPDKTISALPDYCYLLNYIGNVSLDE